MSDSRRVVVTGATGLIGKPLCERLLANGYQVVIFSRNPQRARQAVPGAAEYAAWDYSNPQGAWVSALYGARAVVHLAGAPIFGQRWDSSYKAKLHRSRIQSTRALVKAMGQIDTRPQVFVSGSAVGYYGFRGDSPLDESAGAGSDFLARLCAEWEEEAGAAAQKLGVRTVMVRTGIVMSREGGALPLIKLPFMLGLGGPIMPGTQWLSWIHVDDEVGLLMLALENDTVQGPLNAAAPEPQTNADFSATVGRVLGRPSWLPAPGFALRIALGELADSLVNGQRVLPRKAEEAGYQFQHPTIAGALRDLLNGKT